MSFTCNPTENNVNGKLPSSPGTQSWNFSGDKLKDDLRLFTTGSFYDCTFKISNDDVTNESKVIILKFILLLKLLQRIGVLFINLLVLMLSPCFTQNIFVSKFSSSFLIKFSLRS
jgi:hypothetical protein